MSEPKNEAGQDMETLLKQLYSAKLNVAFFGRTDTGMTTYIRAICSGTDDSERIMLLEDASELLLENKPDLAIVGEIRSKELPVPVKGHSDFIRWPREARPLQGTGGSHGYNSLW